MYKNIFASLICIAMFTMAASAYTISTNARSWWGWTERKDYSDTGAGNADKFLIHGGYEGSNKHGTYDDEWGIVSMIARKIVQHGGYFCPTQLQCGNTNWQNKSWPRYFNPTGYSADKCVWLCEKGYTGENCSDTASANDPLDENKYDLSSLSVAVSMKTSGGNDNNVSSEITVFDDWHSYHDNECTAILGITDHKEHGGVARPVQVCCKYWDGWLNYKSGVKSAIYATNSSKLLCAAGYTPNSNNTDCIPLNVNAAAATSKNFCEGFDAEKFDSAIHVAKNTGGCYKYICKEAGKAFPGGGNFACADCATGIKGGANKDTGVCVVCQTGQYFDQATGTCKVATAVSSTDMQYGKGKTKESDKIDDQCWTKVVPTDYKECVDAN